MSCCITQGTVFKGEGHEPDLLYFRVSTDSKINKNNVINGVLHSTFAEIGILQLFITLMRTQYNHSNKIPGYLFLSGVLLTSFNTKLSHYCWTSCLHYVGQTRKLMVTMWFWFKNATGISTFKMSKLSWPKSCMNQLHEYKKSVLFILLQKLNVNNKTKNANNLEEKKTFKVSLFLSVLFNL